MPTPSIISSFSCKRLPWTNSCNYCYHGVPYLLGRRVPAVALTNCGAMTTAQFSVRRVRRTILWLSFCAARGAARGGREGETLGCNGLPYIDAAQSGWTVIAQTLFHNKDAIEDLSP